MIQRTNKEAGKPCEQTGGSLASKTGIRCKSCENNEWEREHLL